MQLILTFVGQPSVFLHVMEPEVEIYAALDEQRFMALLGLG